MARRRNNLPQSTSGGFVLISLLALLTMGMLYWYVGNLTPDAVVALRQKKTDQALIQARDALLGYALRYREVQAAKDLNSTEDDDRAMYGYLPLPDMGSSRNNNTEIGLCKILPNTQLEGCDANYANITYDSNGMPPTLIGRFPWRTLGTGVLRDGENECLWLVISSSHGRIQRTSPPATPPAMNWDTLGQLEVVTATNAASLQSQLTSKHDRPIAVIFSPGPRIGNQDRAPSTTDDISQCGGNYDAQNYLESLVTTLDTGLASQRTTTSNLFSGAINNASGDTSPDPSNSNPALRDKSKPLSISGNINNQSGNLTKAPCTDCTLVANDRGLSLTSAQFFDKLRAGTAFRTDINSMLERMVGCLRDTGFVPSTITNAATPSDKTIGRIPDNTCYDDNQFPLGYYSNYKDQLFVAKTGGGNFTVTDTSTTPNTSSSNCGGVLIFAGQRGTKNPVPTDSGESVVQLRHIDAVSATNTRANTDWLANYLEGTNLTNFTGTGTDFSGPSTLTQVSATQLPTRDIAKCIPSVASLSSVTSPNLTLAQQLVSYDAVTRTLVLGKLNVTNSTASSAALFGCAWMSEDKSIGSGLRSYFRFSYATLGTTVGNTGFVFAAIDSESNPVSPCGGAGSHLGYSGDNISPPKLAFPKIGIEFDQSRNGTFVDGRVESDTNKGRNDPCYTCGSGTADSHAAIVYWGHESINTIDGVTLPYFDDNVHGFPTTGSLATARRPPKNPNAEPGIIDIPGLRTGGKVYHVRVEMTPTRNFASAAENSTTSIQTKVWILLDGVSEHQAAALKNTTRPMSQLYPSYTETLNDTAVIYDVAGIACVSGSCATGQACGTDNVCYRQGLKNMRLGFTNSQRTQDQQITINDLFTTWLP